jgi:2-dehydro-3-deoxyphosphogluconate aldolase/(4S)-4-hydroxy-2-oxoglutarate aldolase
MSDQQTSQLLQGCPVIPVVAIHNADDAVNLAQALQRGGINAIEITLRTEAGLDAIRRVAKDVPDMVVGVGTVTTPDDAKRSEDAGSQFLVSPALGPKLQQALLDSPLPALPGTASPSEAFAAYEAGFTHLKLFPAGAVGGAALLKGINAPLPMLKFMPTGGVRPENMLDYLSLPNVYAVGGTWIAKSDMIAKGEWATIENNAREAMAKAATLG